MEDAVLVAAKPCQRTRDGFYWIDLEKDLLQSLLSFRAERYGIGKLLAPYFQPHVFAIESHIRDLQQA